MPAGKDHLCYKTKFMKLAKKEAYRQSSDGTKLCSVIDTPEHRHVLDNSRRDAYC